MTTDLTEGKPSQKLFWFSLPLLLSVAFQQLYQMADSVIVGRFAVSVQAGELALAAVGASYPVTQLFMAVATGINIGTSVLVSQLFGARRYVRMKSAVSTALLTTTAVALLLTLAGALGTDTVMDALKTPADIFSDGALYLRVYVFGLLFLFLYNVCTGIFNAMGDSRTPLVLLILSSVSNVILDLVFVAVFHWGVAGVAWAACMRSIRAAISCFFRSICCAGWWATASPRSPSRALSRSATSSSSIMSTCAARRSSRAFPPQPRSICSR